MKKFKNKKTGVIVNIPETHEKQYKDSALWEEYKINKENKSATEEDKKD